MSDLQRSEQLQESIAQLKALRLQAVKKSTQDALTEISERLDQNSASVIWKEFDLHFAQIHEDFYQKLQQINPDLTVRDKRLSALLTLKSEL